jgi:hypothetical protein
MKKWYQFTTSTGDVWRVPVKVIAENRAIFYAKENGIDIEESLQDDTIPLFESDDFEIEDWARNNMDWSDVENHAEKVKSAEPDMQKEWVNPDSKEFLD